MLRLSARVPLDKPSNQFLQNPVTYWIGIGLPGRLMAPAASFYLWVQFRYLNDSADLITSEDN